MSTDVAADEKWEALLNLLPKDLEEMARRCGAITRKRAVKCASDLLRLAMKYALCDTPSRETSAWAKHAGIADMSHVALLKRLQRCGKWLEALISKKLAERAPFPRLSNGGLRVRVTDASCANRPGSKGTDWRIHVGFDLALMQIDSVQLTDSSGGESLSRLSIQPGDAVISDRGYAHRKGINSVTSAGGHVIVRVNWQNLPLVKPDGEPFDILEHLRTLGENGVGDWEVMTAASQKDKIGPIRGRLVALRKDEAAAKKDREKVAKQYRKKGKKPDERTLEAAGYIFVFTTLPVSVLPALEILELFRFRWQVELAFKRLKGILHLDEMPQGKDDLCRTFLLTKLLGALLIEDLAAMVGAFSPGEGGPISSGIYDQSTKGIAGNGAGYSGSRSDYSGIDEGGQVSSGCMSRHAAPASKPAHLGADVCFKCQSALS